MHRTGMIVTMALAFAGCAQIPDVTARYYSAKTDVHVRLVRTLGCDAQNYPYLTSAVTSVITHSADVNSEHTFRPADFGAFFANGDVKLEFYPDGRLKGLNSSATGQAQPILDAAIKVAGGPFSIENNKAKPKCADFRARYADKPQTLVFEVRYSLAEPTSPPANAGEAPAWTPPQPISIPPDPQYADQWSEFYELLGTPCLAFTSTGTTKAPITAKGVSSDGWADSESAGSDAQISLKARQPAQVRVSVRLAYQPDCRGNEIWASVIPVAQLGAKYTIPIPKPPLFGKQTFAASFDEAGGLGVLQYSQDSGATSGLTAIDTAQASGKTMAAEETSALKAEADLIAAQQRLVKCQITPASC